MGTTHAGGRASKPGRPPAATIPFPYVALATRRIDAELADLKSEELTLGARLNEIDARRKQLGRERKAIRREGGGC